MLFHLCIYYFYYLFTFHFHGGAESEASHHTYLIETAFSFINSAARGLKAGFCKNSRKRLLSLDLRRSILLAGRFRLMRSASRSISSLISSDNSESISDTVH